MDVDLHLADVTYIALKVHILSGHAFPGTQTHVLGVASTVLYCLSYMNKAYIYIYILPSDVTICNFMQGLLPF